MMNFIEIAKKRYSVRNYSGKKVEKEKLDKILQAAHVAPTAANLQPVHLIAVESKEGLEKISKGANIYNAPLAIIVCADHNKAWVRPFDQKQTGDIDAAILTDQPVPLVAGPDPSLVDRNFDRGCIFFPLFYSWGWLHL